MKAKVLMVQGTASHVGKSILVAALCRIFHQDGFRVAPFKAQNMSLNSYVTPEGAEIGRAQAVQAEAAGIEPQAEMNPILLKPEADSRSQVVLMGRPLLSTTAKDYYQLKSRLWTEVTRALDTLRSQYEVVVLEGAGSPAEVNLQRQEIVNMRVARYARSPVLLVGDIDRGGVFASLLGTLSLLKPAERKLVKALVINKFRGDLSLLQPGLRFLEQKSGLPVAGVIPYIRDLRLAQEDSVALEGRGAPRREGLLDIAVIRLPHISNFDDFDPLEQEGMQLRYVATKEELGTPDLIILPGSKTTVADLDWLGQSGLADKIREHCAQGGSVIGICGGYQMLGKVILDPEGVESASPERPGLGLLPVTTLFCPSKETHRVQGVVAANRGILSGAGGAAFQGYEIHMARTEVNSKDAPFQIQERSGRACDLGDGYLDASGRVLGTYLHGLFHNPAVRQALRRHLAATKGGLLAPSAKPPRRDDEYDRLADLVRRSLNLGLIYAIAGLRK